MQASRTGSIIGSGGLASNPVSQDGSQQELPEEFFTTADVDSPSVAPSVHSAELESELSSSSPATPEGVSQEESVPVGEFLVSADTVGDSVAPSIHSADLPALQESSLPGAFQGGSQQSLVEEVEEPFIESPSTSVIQTQGSPSTLDEEGAAGSPNKFATTSGVVDDEALGPLGQDSHVTAFGEEVEELEQQDSDNVDDTANIEPDELPEETVEVEELEQQPNEVESEEPEDEVGKFEKQSVQSSYSADEDTILEGDSDLEVTNFDTTVTVDQEAVMVTVGIRLACK